MIITIILLSLTALILALVSATKQHRQKRAKQTFIQIQHRIVADKVQALSQTELKLHLAYQRIGELETRCTRQHQQILDLLKKNQTSPYPFYEFYVVRTGDRTQLIPFHKN